MLSPEELINLTVASKNTADKTEEAKSDAPNGLTALRYPVFEDDIVLEEKSPEKTPVAEEEDLIQFD